MYLTVLIFYLMLTLARKILIYNDDLLEIDNSNHDKIELVFSEDGGVYMSYLNDGMWSQL